MAAELVPGADTSQTAGRRWSPLLAVRVLQGLLWLLVVAAPLVAVVAVVEVSTLRRHLTASPVVVETRVDTSPAEGAAELAVTEFLTGGDEASGWRVEGTVSLGAVEVDAGYVAVTVAARVTPTDLGTLGHDVDQVALPRLVVFTVGVAATGTGWVVTGPPSLIATPRVAPLPEAAGAAGDRVESFPEVEGTVTRFLAALLTGDGELARYTAPGADITAVTPPPFVSVDLTAATSTELADGSGRVAATVTAVDVAGRELVLSYWLVVAERGGRWEVTDLLPAPPAESLRVDMSSGGGVS